MVYHMISIENIIGDYKELFSDLLYRMKQAGITISGIPISHLLYRTTTIAPKEWRRNY